MTIVTRHALRVYAALSGLKADNGGDVLDALIPFMEPILGLMHGKVFDPLLLALGVQRLYGWRFNRDVAEQFAGRLLSKGYLKRAARNVLVVEFEPRPRQEDGEIEIATILERVTDEFESFPPKVTAGVPTAELPADEIMLDGRRFDPAEHFSMWRLRDAEERERRRREVPAALAAALAEVPECRGRWKKVADLLNAREVPTFGGGAAWTPDNVRKAAREVEATGAPSVPGRQGL